MLSESARKTTIWPEWTESELAAEKWDLGGGKGRAKSAAMVVWFYNGFEFVKLLTLTLAV